MTKENANDLGLISGVVIGTALAYSTYQLIKLGADWVKFGIQEHRDRKDS